MSTVIRRVPTDFDWPLNKTWDGYLMPDSLNLPPCPDCDHDQSGHSSGYTREAFAVHNTFYPHMIGWSPGADQLAWYDKIGQAEVDNLIAEGRLWTTVKREPTEDNPRTWEQVAEPRTAAEVNAGQHSGGFNHHDGINRMILVQFRCNVLGIPLLCPTCDGQGDVGTTEQHEAVESWEPTGPPTGDGWQAWENVTEGSPISPVFPTEDGLVAWFVTDGGSLGRQLTRRQAEALVSAGGSVGSAVVVNGTFMRGEEAVAELAEK